MTKLVNHIGFLVRDNIPISIPYWKPTEDVGEDEHEQPVVREDVVTDTDKDMIWAQVEQHFAFLEGTRLVDVQNWVMQKGAITFQSYKKCLTRDYIKKGLTPDFTKKDLGS